MKNYYELLNIMEEHDFSMEMLNQLKDVFQMGGWDNPDFERFSKLFYLKARKAGIKLSDEKMKQILKVIYERGILNLEDIFFIDGAAFEVKGKRDIFTDEYTSAWRVNFVYSSEKYKGVDFLDTTYFFYHHLCNTNKLKSEVATILPQLRKEINFIFVKYYKNKDFPEKLAVTSARAHWYAINYDEEEIINGLNNQTPFNVSIIARVEEKAEIIKMDIECDTSKEKFLTIKNVDRNYEKLTDIIKDNQSATKEKIKL